MNTGDAADDSVMLAKISRLEERIRAAEKAAKQPGGWERYNALNTELHELKQRYFRIRKARRRATEKKESDRLEAKQADAAPASGIGDQDVAKKVAQKKASIPHHARPCEKKKLTEPEHTVFSGDAPCPKCKTLIWVEWQNTTVAMACPKCGFRFDHNRAIAFLSAYNSDDNYKASEAAQAAEVSDVLERAKAVLAKHEAASEEVEDDDEVEPDPISMICPHCLAHYRARLHVGATTRCDECLKDFKVHRHVSAEELGGFLVEAIKGLNPLTWFASEKCPECRSVADKLGKSYSDAGYVLFDGKMIPQSAYRRCYRCSKCRMTWDRLS